MHQYLGTRPMRLPVIQTRLHATPLRVLAPSCATGAGMSPTKSLPPCYKPAELQSEDLAGIGLVLMQEDLQVSLLWLSSLCTGASARV
jgi:hypothetical protein